MVTKKIVIALALGICTQSLLRAMENSQGEATAAQKSSSLFIPTTPRPNTLSEHPSWMILKDLHPEQFDDWLTRRHLAHPFSQQPPQQLASIRHVPKRTKGSCKNFLALCIPPIIIGTLENCSPTSRPTRQRIFILPCYQGTEVEKKLLEKALEIARNQGVSLSTENTEQFINDVLALRTNNPINFCNAESRDNQLYSTSEPCYESLSNSPEEAPTKYFGQLLTICFTQRND